MSATRQRLTVERLQRFVDRLAGVFLSAADGDALVYDAGLGYFVPGTVSGGGGGSDVPTYDSGLVTLPDSLTELTAGTITARAILLVNLTSDIQAVTVTNGADDVYLNAYPLMPNNSIALDLGMVTVAGVKWMAGAADAVNAQLVGDN